VQHGEQALNHFGMLRRRESPQPSGRGGFSCRNSFQTCPEWQRTPNSCSIRCATRSQVHSGVSFGNHQRLY
jgi:hypothetical protein